MDIVVILSLGAVPLGIALWRLFRHQQDGFLKSKVIAATSCSVAVTDATVPRHPVVYANPAFRLLTGYADEEVLGQSLALLNGPQTDRAMTEKLAMAMQDGRACRVLVRHYRKNGTPFWNEVTLSPVKTRAGRVTEYIWVMSDVTQRQQAEDALKDFQEPLRILADQAREGIIVTSESAIVYVNTGGLEMLGASTPNQVIGKPLVSFLHPDSFPAIRQQLESRHPVEPVSRIEGRLLQLDGVSSLEAALKVSPIVWQGKAAALIVVTRHTVHDTTSPIGNHNALRESREGLERAVEAAHVGIFEHAHGTDTLYWSPILREIYGVGADEPVSLQRYLDLIPWEEQEGILSRLRHAHDPAGDGTFHAEHRIVRAGTDIRHVQVQAQTMFEGEGPSRRPIHTIGTVIDVTDRKKAEASQRDSSKMEAIGALAGGIAHEFNNSLTAVLGFSELALPLIPADSKAHRHIQQVVTAGRKSRELVHQLLTFSQRGDHVRRPLSLHSLVKESLKLLRPTVPSWIELRERIASSTRPISADAAHMHQMILHLIENALHAMRKTGGVLEIQLQDKTISTEQVTPHGRLATGCYACLTVRDSGEGMEPEVANHLFDPFSTGRPPEDGRTVGLSVVHEIVTAHGGMVLVESRPGFGTAVSVYLPVLPPRAPAGATQDEPLPHGHECILFVDDEPALARFGGEMLESLGYYPVVRMSATEALQAFKIAPQRFDLLLTDQAMPGMTGDVLARECQRLRPNLPVILCTGSDQTLSADEAHAHGVTEFLLKPLMLHELAHTIRRVLDHRAVVNSPSPDPEHASPTLCIEEHDAVSTRR